MCPRSSLCSSICVAIEMVESRTTVRSSVTDTATLPCREANPSSVRLMLTGSRSAYAALSAASDGTGLFPKLNASRWLKAFPASSSSRICISPVGNVSVESVSTLPAAISAVLSSRPCC